eukprot:12647553-Ditylum_brightwellii.AAC.1
MFCPGKVHPGKHGCTHANSARHTHANAKSLMKFALCPKHTDPNAMYNEHHQALLAWSMRGKFFIQQEEVPGVDLAQSHIWLCR